MIIKDGMTVQGSYFNYGSLGVEPDEESVTRVVDFACTDSLEGGESPEQFVANMRSVIDLLEAHIRSLT
jgi:hypothetical protein